MKKRNHLLCLCTLALGLLATSCDDNADDPQYRSLPPRFADVELKMLNDGSSKLKAGEKIVATAVQKKKGRLLYKARYKWSTSPLDMKHRYKNTVIYDNESANPTDTLVFNAPGTYEITLDGQYYTSGQSESINETEHFDKGKAIYSTPSFQYYRVKVQKSVRVY